VLSVSYDHQIFSIQRYGGISRYIYEIATRISSLEEFDVKITAGLHINEYLDRCSSTLVKGWKLPRIKKTPTIVLSKLNEALLKTCLNYPCPNVIHETYYCHKSIAPKKSKIVLTVHDMIHEKFSHLMPRKDLSFSIIKAKAINRADHIICVSENTKRDLVDILNVDPKKISTIYHGVTLSSDVKSKKNPKLDYPYILYVGERISYKNFDRLLQAYATKKNVRDGFKLVCFGGSPFSNHELFMIRSLGLDDKNIVFTSGDDQILKSLYTHASAFIYPSLYEGFGLPLLEAMSCGCPVICSNTSSILEVVSDRGEYFDPYEIDSISDALEKVLFSSERTKELINKGRNRVKDFSWETCAKKTSLVYQLLS
jgi:glycosyltransferase involved in cell wall biosynthesis